MHESEIIIKLAARNPSLRDEELEAHMFEVLEAVEEYASDVALGPVVAVDFDERVIELAFSVCHNVQSEAQHKIAEVLGVVEQRTNLRFGGPETAVRDPSADHDSLALA